MPKNRVQFQETPNPHAIKCVVGSPLPALTPASPATGGGDGLRSYASREAAERDPIARALFSIEGVVGVLVGEGWVTIRKAPVASWGALRPSISRRIEEALRGA